MNKKPLHLVLLLLSVFWGNAALHAQISGTVYNDVNGMTDNTVNGTGVSSALVNVVLVNSGSNTVTAAMPVGSGGAYSFTGVSSASYKVMVTTASATVGSAPPSVLLPSGWVSTGEKLGTGTGNDGTVDGMLSIGTVATVVNANFGIEQTPASNTNVYGWQGNPGGTASFAVPANQFGGTDPSGGSLDSLFINSFPTFTTTLTVGSNSYTSVTFPSAGLPVATNSSGYPVPAISIDPQTGNGNVVIDFTVMDNAQKMGSSGSLTIPFHDLISGTVHNDVNGLTDNIVNGAGVDSGLLNVVLVDTVTDKVVAVMPVQDNGYFGFTDTAMHTGNQYRVLITTSSATIGANQPAIVLPSNWVLTGEFFGDGPGNDGQVNGILYAGTLDSFTNKAHLSLEQRPNTVSDTADNLDNPGGTVSVTLNTTDFHGIDSSGGHIDSLRILAFPSNTTTLTVGGTPYTTTTFPAGGVSMATNTNGNPIPAITLDPVDGAVMAIIPYTVIDNADTADITPGHLGVPFVVMGSSTAEELAQTLTGTGVIVLNPVLNGTCPDIARGTFNFFGPNDLGIDSGIVLTCGSAVSHGFYSGINAPASNEAAYQFPGGSPFAPGDPDLNALLLQNGSSATTNDACVLEFDFVPAGDSIKFDYVFGSEEYPEWACSGYNDVFGFFISGPGFTGLNNIALVPNTTIPVAINTINMGAGVNGSIGNCTGMGTGSPFGQYYIDNLGTNGQQIVYDGFTTVLTALASVSPCDTYHLKLAIADAGDGTLDSGVFLKAGSLSSTAIKVKTYGGAGLETPFTNTVRGCPPGVVRISRNGNLSQPVTIPLQISGTAVNGVDYQTIPNSVTIPAGDSAVSIDIYGIPVFPPQGPKSCVVAAVSPYTCGNGAPVIISSDTIMIYDSIYVNIVNPDTAICFGESVNLKVEADSLLDFKWTPTEGLSDSTIQNVTATPDTLTTYTVSVKLPFVTGCPPSTDKVTIDVKHQPQIDLGDDVYTCGDAVQLNAATTPPNPDETFSWTPPGGLSNPSIRNPLATITSTTTYVVTVNPGATGCNGVDSIQVTLLPDHIDVLNNDTTVCSGAVLELVTDGDEHFHYNWTPEQDIANDTMKNTTLTARQSGYYTLTASFPGCLDMPDSFYVEVQPVPQVQIGPDRVICSYDTIQFYGSVQPDNYQGYSYLWQPGSGFSDSTVQAPVFSGDESGIIRLEVRTPIGCLGADSMRVTVNPGDFLLLQPGDTGICPPSGVQLMASGAQTYSWSPASGLDHADIANPYARPQTSTEYQLIGMSALNCYDTQTLYIEVYPSAVINLPDSVTIWPGESYQINPGGNALYYSWFPPSGLSADDIANPVAEPLVRTRYFVTARTENGCIVKDSIDVLVNTESVLDLPNAFTPGNGINGEFRIIKRGMATLRYFRVYNRWGNKVFETTDINRGWDGTFNGVAQPAGVYVYSVDAVTSTGQEFHKGGNVTLIR